MNNMVSFVREIPENFPCTITSDSLGTDALPTILLLPESSFGKCWLLADAFSIYTAVLEVLYVTCLLWKRSL